MGYQRWYDHDPKLAHMVHSLELLRPETQLAFASKLLELSQTLIESQGGAYYYETLSEQKQIALQRASQKKRWYDQDGLLHQAFNQLYALSSIDRQLVSLKLNTPIKIISGYESYCTRLHTPTNPNVIQEILRTCLIEGSDRAKRLYSLYLSDTYQRINPEHAGPKGVLAKFINKLFPNAQTGRWISGKI